MAQVSRRPLHETVEKSLNQLFDELVGRCATSEEARTFIKDILTETELVVVQKRLAIALLLLKGFSYGQIDKMIKVSPPTVFKVKEWMKYKGPAFEVMLKRLLESERGSEVWDNMLKASEELLKGEGPRARKGLLATLTSRIVGEGK